MNPDDPVTEQDIWDAGYKAALSDLDLGTLYEATSEGWQDIHELVRHEKYLRDGGTMFITDNGITQSERVIAMLKAASVKLREARMKLEGVTEQDIAETKPE